MTSFDQGFCPCFLILLHAPESSRPSAVTSESHEQGNEREDRLIDYHLHPSVLEPPDGRFLPHS